MLKLALGLVLVAHGIGHSMGILGAFKIATVNPAWAGDSWLLAGAGQAGTQVVGTLLWSVALVGFVLLGGVVLGWLPEAWWQPLAIGSAAVSLLGVLLFPIAFPTFSTLGCVAVDVAVLAAATWYAWVPSDLAA